MTMSDTCEHDPLAPEALAALSPELRAFYTLLLRRRDIRAYRPDPVPDPVLRRVLAAAHHAPSVGFMQPWNFILVEDPKLRQAVYADFRRCNEQAAGNYEGDRGATYRSLKLQGILDAPVNLLVTCDTTRAGPHVLGRDTMPEMDRYSTVLAIQNLWLAATAEGLGVGWVSILEPATLRRLFALPDHVVPIAYLTLGWPTVVPERPLLETIGWRRRLALSEVVLCDRWGEPAWPKASSSLESTASGAAAIVTVDTQPSIGSGSEARRLAAARNRELAKPPGSLGRLEERALALTELLGDPRPRPRRPHLVLFAGDHGLARHHLSAYRAELTRHLVYAYLSGNGTAPLLARRFGVPYTVVDVGVDHDFGNAPGLVVRKVRRGTSDIAQGPALKPEETLAALQVGAEVVENLGTDLLLVGEVGIGNSTSAAALGAALLGLSPDRVIGPGTGVGQSTLARKRAVVARALARIGEPSDPTRLLGELGGCEIAALVGAIEAAARAGIPVLLDGLATGVAALVAVRRVPRVRRWLIASHRSTEPLHRYILAALELEPLLELELRLGEGSGALLAYPLLDAALLVQRELHTFTELGIPEPEDPRGRR